MLKPKFQALNDGVINVGILEESYDKYGNALDEKQFILKETLFFSYQYIREEDMLKYDKTGHKLTLKIKTKYLHTLRSSYVVELNGSRYSILYIDPDNAKENMYIYLTDLINELDKHVSIFIKETYGPLEDDKWSLYKIVWANISNSSYKSEEDTKANKLSSSINKNIVIRYLEQLDLSVNNKATVDFKIKYKDNFYNILQISNINEDNKLLELYVKGE